MECRVYLTVDYWSRILGKSYTLSPDKEIEPFQKYNITEKYHLVKGIYKCKSNTEFKKVFVTPFARNKVATQTYSETFKNAERYAMNFYNLPYGTEGIAPDSKTPNIQA